MNHTITRHLPRRLGLTLFATAALALVATACGGDDDGDSSDSTTSPATTPASTTAAMTVARPADDIDAFCRAEVAVEAAVMTEDPSAMGAAFDALAAASPAEVKPAVETAIAAASAGNEDSPEFASAYGQMIDYVKGNCGFGDLEVTGSEYAFSGIPASLDGGPQVITFENTGTEVHEMTIVRVHDGVTETAAELIALPEEEAQAKTTQVGGTFAMPGEVGNTVVDLAPGRYIALCFLPQGATPDHMADIQAGQFDGAPHTTLGMIQEFEVA